MNILLSIAFTMIAAVAFAQDAKTDTVHRYKFNEPIDTTGMGQYGMRLYDTRMTRYLAPDTAYKKNPYYFADKKKKKQKSR